MCRPRFHRGSAAGSPRSRLRRRPELSITRRSTRWRGGSGWIAASWLGFLSQAIADAAHRADQACLSLAVNFAPQKADEGIQRVSPDLPVESPHRFDQGSAGYGPPGTAHEVFEEVEFRARKADAFPGAADLMRRGYEN